MKIKRLLLVNGCALALLGATAVSAHTPTENASARAHHHHCRFAHALTPEQKTELQQIHKDLRAQLLPLIKEKRALKLQIMGKMATPDVQWSEVASLVDKKNANHAKITTLVAKTRFETYQKLGIMLPMKHHHHQGWKKQS